MRYFEEKHFVEDISLYFEQMGLPRMAGRVLGVLLISDPLAQSLTDLCEILQASKSSISTTTRLLTEMGLIERAASPVPRQVFFQFKPGGWVVFIRQRLRLWASLHQLAERIGTRHYASGFKKRTTCSRSSRKSFPPCWSGWRTGAKGDRTDEEHDTESGMESDVDYTDCRRWVGVVLAVPPQASLQAGRPIRPFLTLPGSPILAGG